ncbi:Holliday junction resolvase RuvX [Acidisoma cellulosilytica]|uniref:Putative pre-16S rRNA nuclease n=1 Tax=Acidisoma cellulosilyticum TaxID=2802395 RepID=A0A963Z2P8_9PROT|nr:Holliday junction resolvase RuvX [Acidisoma cellulosilyticum]MCB8881665.1 Holliday junction resolvase RuvX [Acidisoma cellulosilyticum]
MTVINFEDLCAGLAHNERLIGLDPGSKTIGVALSDVRLKVASPYGSIRRGKLSGIVEQLGKLIMREEVGGLIVGLPLGEDGRMGPAAQAARDWAWAISDALELPAALWDETLTTSAVHEILIGEADLSRKRRAAVVDRMAAARILQSALDSRP